MSVEPQSQRIDLLLCRLRFTKTRGLAQRLVEAQHLRCNGARVQRASHCVKAGDVLTFADGRGVWVVQILQLPQRRGPACEAQEHYRTLDPTRQTAIAAPQTPTPPEEDGT